MSSSERWGVGLRWGGVAALCLAATTVPAARVQAAAAVKACWRASIAM